MDKTLYLDQTMELIAQTLNVTDAKHLKKMTLGRYYCKRAVWPFSALPSSSGPHVALVSLEGSIHVGKSQRTMFGDCRSIGSETVWCVGGRAVCVNLRAAPHGWAARS